MLQSWSVYSDGAEKTVYRHGACSSHGLFTPTGRRKQCTDTAHAPVMVCLLRRGGENVEYRRGACSRHSLFTPTGRRKQWSTDAAHAQTRFR
ncbi:unnamed protein product [Sphagnum balticum]